MTAVVVEVKVREEDRKKTMFHNKPDNSARISDRPKAAVLNPGLAVNTGTDRLPTHLGRVLLETQNRIRNRDRRGPRAGVEIGDTIKNLAVDMLKVLGDNLALK